MIIFYFMQSQEIFKNGKNNRVNKNQMEPNNIE